MTGDQNPKKRREIGYLDVLIGSLILVLAIAIVLPWLNWNRTHHRGRSVGASQLMQIALALHWYNDRHNGKLPPLIDVGAKAPHNAGLNSLFFEILPFLEQDNVYRVFKQTTPTYANSVDAKGAAVSHFVKVLVAPADSTMLDGAFSSQTISLPWQPPAPFLRQFSGSYATTSYAANGLVFGTNDSGIPRTFIDGTSNTILIAQRPQVCDPMDGSPPVYNLWGFGYYGPTTPSFALLTPDEPAGMPSTGQASPELQLPSEWTKDKIRVRIGRESAPIVVPEFTTPFQHVVKGKPCDPRILGTPHKSGMLVALADGSVRSINPEISSWTFWASCTPAGNESLREDWQ